MRNAEKPYFRNEPSCYAIRAGKEPGERIKIGYTCQVSKRVNNLQLKTPRMLKILMVIPGDFHLEKKLHQAFAEYRISPFAEWFLAQDQGEQLLFDQWCVRMHHDDQFRELQVGLIQNEMRWPEINTHANKEENHES